MTNIYILPIIAAISVWIGYWASKNLSRKTEEYKEYEWLSHFIRAFAGIGVGFASFGLLFIISSNLFSTINWEEWKPSERQIIDSKEVITDKHQDPFELKSLNFTEDSIKTTTVIFTISGLFLGALGIFWLGFLEATRNNKDRKHDQEIQKDRILSLLSLGIDLFITIDEKVLDFMDENRNCKNDTNCIEFNGKYYKKFSKEEYEINEKLKIKYEKHLTSLYKFLYERKNFKKQTILEDIYKIIDELQLVFYEKDLILYRDKDEKKRELFIKLLKQYTDYKNFLSGNTDISDFAIVEFKSFDKNINTLLNSNNANSEHNPIIYLKAKYDEDKKKEKIVFFETFTKKISKEFAEVYLIKESSLFSIFNIADIKDNFLMMQISSLDSAKFFNAYFISSFKEYIENKALYKGELNLKENDLNFEEYMEIFEDAFKNIESDINSVKELYSLFYSFVALQKEFNQESGVVNV